MPVPTVGEQWRDQGAPFLFPLHSLFFQNEWIFQKLHPLCPIIDSDYPNFMLPSQCEEVPWVLALSASAMQQGPQGVVLATLHGFERKGWREERKLKDTHTHTLSMTCTQSMIGRQRFKPCKEDNFIGDHLKKTKQDIYIKASWHLLSHTSLSLGFDQLQHVLT